MSERLLPDPFPASPYAQALRRGQSRLSFEAPLEARYRHEHLQRMRLRVRLWFSFAALVAMGDLLLRLLFGYDRHSPVAWAYGVADGCDLCLAALAWSPGYLRYYLPAARVLVPLLGAATAVFVARALFIGQGQQLAVMTLNIFVFCFFAGLLSRAALVATLLSIASYIAAVSVFGSWHVAACASLAMLLISGSICLLGYRDIERSYRRAFLERALIGELVAHDELSGLLNRRAFYEQLQRLWLQAIRERHALAVLMVDIDHFKLYNDTHGHQAGDTALRSVARLLKATLARRPSDLAARYGGDEFIAVLPEVTAPQALELAERLRTQVLSLHREPPRDGWPATPVTISIGVGAVLPAPDRTAQGAIQLADEALYEAKQSGRNAVVLKGPEDYHRLDTGSFRQAEPVRS